MKSKILINGLEYRFRAPLTIFELLNYLGFNTNLVVVDYNKSILQKEFWPSTTLQANDKIEILTIAGGG